MKLSDKLKQLQQEFRFDEMSDQEAIEDGFNRCIEDAEFLESALSHYKQSEAMIPGDDDINAQASLKFYPDNYMGPAWKGGAKWMRDKWIDSLK